LPEISKYDMFLDELNSLEKQIYYFIQKGTELLEANEGLNQRITTLEKENDALKRKISEIESKLSKTLLNEDSFINAESLKLEDREALRSKISELIAKIDYHLRS
jgi:predicted  nucleic acid-binding Zn-ribbon protein